MYTNEDFATIARIHKETGKWAKLLKPTALSTAIRTVAGFRPMPSLAVQVEHADILHSLVKRSEVLKHDA